MTPIEIIEAMQGKRIAVVGDPMVDHYIFGRVERICPEAPVPVFIPEREERRPGGAANVSRQINALGCVAHSLMPQKVSIKTRYMSGHHILLRVDQDATYYPEKYEVLEVAQQINHDAVVLSDYARGWLSREMCDAVICAAHRSRIPVIVDPKADLMRFVGCDLICPTEEEFETVAFPNVLLKRGAKGMRLFENFAPQSIDIPAVARRVFDVTGAGDTVVAVVTAAVAAGASYLEAAQLAAVAAGYVVGEVGTTVCPLDKLKELVNAGATRS
jgi:bifunctional ADP-heptose synthase (sugar kinase/adenylyltransferase)